MFMPIITCQYDHQEITIIQALEIRNNNRNVYFECLGCNERLFAHNQRADQQNIAHFEHQIKNKNCPLM